MDDVDSRILEALQQDARISMKELGGIVHLSVPAVSERVKKLERSGCIRGYTALLDNAMLGRPYCCFCLVVLRANDAASARAFLSHVENTPDILECHRITGAYEYILKIETASPKALELLLCALRDCCGVSKSSTFTVLSTFKTVSSVTKAKQGL